MQNPNVEDAWAEIDIRDANASDAAAIEKIIYEAFKEYESLYTKEAFAVATPKKETILQRMKEGPMWVAVFRGDVVGTISAVPRDREFQIRMMAVPPSERGRAIGRMLLVHAAKFAFRSGYRKMSLKARPFHTRAIREYEHFGFYKSEDGPRETHGTPVYRMEKLL